MLNIQFVFAVKYRAAQIDSAWKDELHQKITDVVKRNRHKMLQINSMADHIHVFIGMGPSQSVDSLAEMITEQSSEWINDQLLCSSTFSWQEGYGAFSYSESDIPDITENIKNQEIYHQKETFLDEYKRLLTLFEVEWEEQDIFKELE